MDSLAAEDLLARVRYDARGLVPCIVQHGSTGRVLMLAYANEQALRRTLATGEAHFWSRSRDELWHKGATSGNVQRVRAISLDCDHDTVLLEVEPAGPACHTGAESCFDAEASQGSTLRLSSAG